MSQLRVVATIRHTKNEISESFDGIVKASAMIEGLVQHGDNLVLESEALAREAALREELAVSNSAHEVAAQNHGALNAEIFALQQRLTVAEQELEVIRPERDLYKASSEAMEDQWGASAKRADELEVLLTEWRHGHHHTLKSCAIILQRTDAALKPAAGAKCDGNHGGPRCDDPECWNADATLNPFAGCSLAGGKSHNSLGPKDADGNLVCTCGFAWGLPF